MRFVVDQTTYRTPPPPSRTEKKKNFVGPRTNFRLYVRIVSARGPDSKDRIFGNPYGEAIILFCDKNAHYTRVRTFSKEGHAEARVCTSYYIYCIRV